MAQCEKHEELILDFHNLKSENRFMGTLMKKIDKELEDIKKSLEIMKEKIHSMELRNEQLPLKIILIGIGLTSSVSAIVSTITMFILKLTGVI